MLPLLLLLLTPYCLADQGTLLNLFGNIPQKHEFVESYSLVKCLMSVLSSLSFLVCFNFTDYDINITINNTRIIEDPPHAVRCSCSNCYDGCVFDCTFAKGIKGSWFKDSTCLEAKVSQSANNYTTYSMEHS